MLVGSSLKRVNLDLPSKIDVSDLVQSEQFKITMLFPLSGLRMAKTLDNAFKIAYVFFYGQ